MRPPLAIARRARITILVREWVVLTIDGHPQAGAPSKGDYAANREKILKPLGPRIRAVGEPSVIIDAEAKPPSTQYNSATNSAGQVKKNSAATAPM